KRRTDHRSAGRQRAPRPPDMQRADMAMANTFLAPGVGRDALDRQVDLDQATGVGSGLGHSFTPLVSLSSITCSIGFTDAIRCCTMFSSQGHNLSRPCDEKR